MTAMDVQPVSAPQPESVSNSVPPPAPPPPPGCPGSFQMPHWRSEPLPAHLAPTKEQIDKEQYAHLPDKLLNSMNKDKKPFTYTPSGVSGTEKGLLDLSSIRSPRMKKRLLANIADGEESSDQFDSERVTRSETPEITGKQKPMTENTRRAITPEISLNKQIYAPVLPPKEMLNQRPVVQKYKSEEELDAYVQKQMNEMEKTLKNQKNQFDELEPEVKELIDSYKNVQQSQRTVPIEVITTPATPELRREEEVVQRYGYSEPESTKPAVEQTMSYRMDYNRSPISQRNQPKDPNNGINNSSVTNHRFDSKRENVFNKNTNNNNNDSNPWDSDLLRHVLDGGLQEEIEKFEKISLETQNSFSNPKRNDTFYDRETTPTFETFGRSLPNPSPNIWSPNGNAYPDPYANRNQTPSPYGSLNRNANRNGVWNPQPTQTQTESISQAISSVRQFWNEPRYWSESPVPSTQHHYERETASVEPVYRGHDIPSNQYRQQPMTGYMPSEVPNYNSRAKPFYLCSPPPTPTPTPPPPSQFMSQTQPQPIHRPRDQQFTTFGKNISPQKINYQNEISNSGYSYESSPQRKYIENIGMYAQTSAPEEWERPTSPPSQAHRNIKFNDQVITTPDRHGIKSPEPPKPILKKKLPPSERPPDPTPPKYMGGNIPSRSFRVLQLMTGEDIDNQFISNDFGFETKSIPKSKPFKKTVSYSNYEDFGTDF